MPKNVSNSFNEVQLIHLKAAIGARQWGRHSVDFRGVIGFFAYRYYFVFLAGRNKRSLSSSDERRALILQALILSVLIICTMFIFFLFLYLVKSALGIDLIDGFSLGIW
jgi:hypothetical protein